jgi:hypothetical protein
MSKCREQINKIKLILVSHMNGNEHLPKVMSYRLIPMSVSSPVYLLVLGFNCFTLVDVHIFCVFFLVEKKIEPYLCS